MFVNVNYIQHFLHEYIYYLYLSQNLGSLLPFEDFSNDFILKSCSMNIGLVFLRHTHTQTHTYHRIPTKTCISVFAL